ncbi:MAG: glycosyltransferase, partial [Bacteroidota bacterium]|nr:glycosyltransferase [Bacteroidota bacterium]
VSFFQKITVFYVKKDERGILEKNTIQEIRTEGALTEVIIYFKCLHTPLPILNRLISHARSARLYRQALRRYIEESGKPDLVHVHVAYKAGIQALWLKKKFGIPFILSEHWSGYLPESHFRFEDFPKVIKRIIAKIFKGSSSVSAVSQTLGQQLKTYFQLSSFRVIPNVVDISLFYPSPRVANPVREFIHISNLTPEKNITEILRAFDLVLQRGLQFHLRIFGPPNEAVASQITQLGLEGKVEMMREIPQIDLAAYLRIADALILYSSYETFGCVVIEASASGVPVILSDLPVFREFVIDGKEGVMVHRNAPQALAGAIEDLISGKYRFDSEKIAEGAVRRFSFEVVGNQMNLWYREVLGS